MSCNHSQQGVYIACVHCDIEHATLAERERIIKLLEGIAIETKNGEIAVMELLSAIEALIKGENK